MNSNTIIATALVGLSLSSLASAAVFVDTTSQVAWETSIDSVYTSPRADYYNDQFLNIAQSGSSVTGGHGWGAFTANSLNSTSVVADTIAPNMIVANNGSGQTQLTFNFSNSTGGLGGMYGVGFFFNVSSTTAVWNIVATFGSTSAGVNTTFALANNWIGFYTDSPAGALTVTFTSSLASGSNNTIEVYEAVYAVVPAPGAAALLGIAGMVGARRRR
jgi:hypothetical protein